MTNSGQYQCAAFIIDTWVDAVAQGRTNVAPVKMPWELLRTLITEMYGGKIDDEGDFQQLSAVVDQCMTPGAFEDGHLLVAGAQGEEGEEEEGGAYRQGDGGAEGT